VLVVLVGLVWFRAPDIHGAIEMFEGMIGLNGLHRPSMALGFGLHTLSVIAMIVGGLIAFVRWPRWSWFSGEGRAAMITDFAFIGTLLIVSVIWIGGTNATPFLYYRF